MSNMPEINLSQSLQATPRQAANACRTDLNLQRPQVRGKFLYVGDNKFWIRGVTYGAFRPDAHGHEYHDLDVVERDFAHMASSGLNTVRIPHTIPPRSLLDAAQRHGLRVMVGLSAEQYVGFLIDRKKAPDIPALVRARVEACCGHPALLCYAIGNEIPAALVRWLGRRRVERYIKEIYHVIKAEDPEGLVSYVNYPTTEYLQLPFLDLVCFNVYLEAQDRLAAYLARLQNIAGDDRPLVMSEVGLDSLRNGEETQARMLDWQIRTAFAAGCVGAFIFAWTDEWYRGGADVDDWAFGLTDQKRHPKPALAAVCQAFNDVPFPPDVPWPRISVVVCTYNGSHTIRDCLEGLRHLEYPDFEVIVVNDGSTDTTADIVSQYDYRLISTPNYGLSSARNTGWQAATGEIVAYIDDDAYPDPHWLTYLADTFMHTTHVSVGGPNLPPAGDGPIAECIANAPGGPVHVLLSDHEAEHIPGCNMAFRTKVLQAIGGFDTQFRIAGDDVDMCWRLQQQGWTIGFNPVALVWHHRRNAVRTYWKQQLNYGKAETLLERKWPEKYNAAGHLTWAGRVYGNGHRALLGLSERIYHGTWGSAPFQSLYRPAAGTFQALTLMPEWYLVIVALAVLASLGLFWSPLFLALPCLLLAVGIPVSQAVLSAVRVSFTSAPRTRLALLKRRALTAGLSLLQPLARLCGRMRYGLTPWRHSASGYVFPWPHTSAIWTEDWQEPATRLHGLEADLRASNVSVLRGGDYDRWDLEVRSGLLGTSRFLMAVEDHGSGTQFIRYASWPTCSLAGVVLILLCTALAVAAGIDYAWTAATILCSVAALLALRTFQECAGSMATILRALTQQK
jgi:O-antigen biosynthesis protein